MRKGDQPGAEETRTMAWVWAEERQMNAKFWESLDFISLRHGILVKEVSLPNLEGSTRVIPKHS